MTFQLGKDAAQVPVRTAMRQLATPRCPPSGDGRQFPLASAKKISIFLKCRPGKSLEKEKPINNRYEHGSR